MKFKKFCDIENSYNKNFLDNISFSFDYPCVVLNKVDGSNFSILVDKTGDIRFASRNQIIDKNNNFFNCILIFETIKNNILNLSNDIFSKYGNIDTVQFVGEIFGGYYPHPNVSKVSKAQSVQGRVFYIPDNDIIFYDIILNFNDGTYKYLNWKDVEELYKKYGLKIVDVIDKDKTIKEAIDTDYNSLIDPTYKQYNLPEIENNFSEGVIIRPLVEVVLNNGERLIIKQKSEKFLEKKSKSYKNNDFNIDDYSDEFKNIYNTIFDYITESRYFSVISKMDPSDITPEKFGLILKNYNEDVIKDYNKENNNLYDNLGKNEKSIINKEINKKSSLVIKKQLIGG